MFYLYEISYSQHRTPVSTVHIIKCEMNSQKFYYFTLLANNIGHNYFLLPDMRGSIFRGCHRNVLEENCQNPSTLTWEWFWV